MEHATVPRKTGPHNARSIRKIRAAIKAALVDLDAVQTLLDSLRRAKPPEDDTIYPLGSRGMMGTGTYKGALKVLASFSKDAKLKAEQAVRDAQRKKKNPPMV